MIRPTVSPSAQWAIRLAPFLLGGFLLATVAPFANVPLPRALLPILSLFLGAAPVANLASCVLLISLFFTVRRRSFVVLGAVFGLSAIVGFGRFLLLPLSTSSQNAALPVGPNALGWMLVDYHFELCLGIFVYAWLRRAADDHGGWRRRTQIVTAFVFVIAVAAMLTIPVFSERLPHLVTLTDISALETSGIGWAMFATTLAALVAVIVVAEDVLDVALTFSLMATCVEIALVTMTAHRFSAGWFMSQFGSFWAAIFFPIGLSWQLMSANRRLSATQRALAQNEERAREYAGRLAAL